MSDLRKLLDEATPGSWEITGRKITKHGGTYDFISGFKWGKFARVVVRFDYDYADNPAGVANARLIALAPDLAAALLKAEEALTFSQSVLATLTDGEANRSASGLSIQSTWANCVAAEVKARAALTEIRKLTGAA